MFSLLSGSWITSPRMIHFSSVAMLKEHWLPVPRVQYLQYHQASAPRLSGLVRFRRWGRGNLALRRALRRPNKSEPNLTLVAGCWYLMIVTVILETQRSPRLLIPGSHLWGVDSLTTIKRGPLTHQLTAQPQLHHEKDRRINRRVTVATTIQHTLHEIP
ncbi:Uncharacterized protein HZ326_2437 [Fusarium oxysporum f. sp. albedinis]|nr:Uncharacterized protein HZ326_2437 [Fusarium oxysporum f. sp. albedinis]